MSGRPEKGGMPVDGPWSFEVFWNFLTHHPNCILRAGTHDAILYDDEDLHWHLAQEPEGAFLVQLVRGKRLLGEILVEPEQVAYVQGSAGESGEEYLFELIAETESDRYATYFFVLSHGFEVHNDNRTARVH